MGVGKRREGVDTQEKEGQGVGERVAEEVEEKEGEGEGDRLPQNDPDPDREGERVWDRVFDSERVLKGEREGVGKGRVDFVAFAGDLEGEGEREGEREALLDLHTVTVTEGLELPLLLGRPLALREVLVVDVRVILGVLDPPPKRVVVGEGGLDTVPPAPPGVEGEGDPEALGLSVTPKDPVPCCALLGVASEVEEMATPDTTLVLEGRGDLD